jgi:ribosomal protein L29
MATKGHKRGHGKDLKKMSNEDMDKELKEIIEEIDKMMLKM